MKNQNRLSVGGTYEMYVASVLFNRPFPANGKNWYSYNITVRSTEGVVYVPEYVFENTMDRQSADQLVNSIFRIGEMAKFRCTISVDKCDEIVPTDQPKTSINVTKQNSVSTVPHTLISGQSYSQSMTLAVQLACAECTSLGKEINMEEIYKRAAEMDDWFMQRKEMHGF